MDDLSVIQSVPRDSIPALTEPEFGRDYIGRPDDRVFVVDVGDGPARAYPNRIVWYHEIVNDVVDGVPILVAWCEICGSSAAYRRDIGERTLTFGQRGKLANDNMVMYDHETESEWKQSGGKAISGPYEGDQLEPLPITMMTWEQFQAEYPDGLVLQPAGGESKKAGSSREPEVIDYSKDEWEVGYLESDLFGRYAVYDLIGQGSISHYDEDEGRWVELEKDHPAAAPRTWSRDDLAPKDVVLGIEADGEAVGVPQESLQDEGGVVQTRVGEQDVVVFETVVSEKYPFPQAYVDPGFQFEVGEVPNEYDGDGTTWNALTGQSKDGRQLEHIPQRRQFAFTWQDDHGPDSFYQRS